jgi:transposase
LKEERCGIRARPLHCLDHVPQTYGETGRRACSGFSSLGEDRQKGHGAAHQTCLAHLARDVAYADEASDDMLPSRLELWLKRAFALAEGIETFAASTIAAKRRALERSLADILAAPTACDLARDLQHKFRRARDQLLTFAAWPGLVEPTNNACERALRPAVVQRKVTNGYRAMWAAQGEADIRTVVDTARLRTGAASFQTILNAVAR